MGGENPFGDYVTPGTEPPPVIPPNPADFTNTGDGDGDSGGGGGSTAAPDPLAGFSFIEKDKYYDFQSIYSSLWDEPATVDYLRGAIKRGMNAWEFEDAERHKPAFQKTRTYYEEISPYADYMRSLGIVGFDKRRAPQHPGKKHKKKGN